MARPNPLADPEFAKLVAEAFANGESRRAMAEKFNVKDLDTISRWRRHPAVRAHAFKVIEDRVLQVTRRVDGIIAARLDDAENMTIKELLDIRKEFAGGQLRDQLNKADETTVAQAHDLIENDPELADKLEALLSHVGPSSQ